MSSPAGVVASWLLICPVVWGGQAKFADLRMQEKAVVMIKNGRSIGSGFFINSYGVIVMCWHAVRHPAPVWIRWKGSAQKGVVLYSDQKYDQALVSVLNQNTPYLRILPPFAERIDKGLLKEKDFQIFARKIVAHRELKGLF